MVRVADIALRVGVAFAFLYPPVNALGDPNAWIGYFPGFMRGVVPDEILLQGFGLLEVILALWILSGWRIVLPSIAAAGMLIAIVGFNISEMQVVFRDISIALMAVALAALHYPRKEITKVI